MSANLKVLGGLLAGSFLILFGVAQTAGAGQQPASIVGRVTDESGGILPGVTVRATSPSLQLKEVAGVTDDRGEYRLSPLPIGTYDVEFSLEGFQAVRREGVRLTVGFAARLDEQMKIGTLAESVTVSGASPVVDVSSTATNTQFTRETLETLPTSRNGITALLGQAPGVRTTLDVGGSSATTSPGFRSFGQAGESYQLLEGVNNNMNQGAASGSGNYWDYATLEEANVQTLGGGADIPNRGIALFAIVKPGGNTFHGGVWGSQIFPRFQSSNIDDGLRNLGITEGNKLLTRWDASADLGGRLILDKLWFYGAVRQRRDSQTVLNAFKPDGSPATVDQAVWYHTEKLSAQLNSAHRLIGFYTYTHKEEVSGVSETVAWESRTDLNTLPYTGKIEWQFVSGNSFMLSAQYGSSAYTAPRFGNSDRVPTTDIVTLRVAGEATTAGSTGYIGPLHHTKASATWYRPDTFKGDHEIKFGFDYENEGVSRASGTDPSNPRNYNHQLVFNNGVPFQVNFFNSPYAPESRLQYLAMYVMDKWTIARRLTLNLGLRYAHDNGFVPANCRDAATGPSAAIFGAECHEEIQFNVWNPVAPRIFAAYDLTGDGRTVVKGGFGVYHQRRRTGDVTTADPIAAATATYRWQDLNGNADYDPGEINLDPAGDHFVTQSGGSVGIVNPDEREPWQVMYSISLERELFPSFAARLTGVYARTFDGYRETNPLRPPGVYTIPVTRPDPGPDARLGTADDPGTFVTYYEYPIELTGRAFERRMLTNDPRNSERYKSVEVAASKRLDDRWQLMTSVSATQRHVPFVPGAGFVTNSGTGSGFGGGLSADTPNAEINSTDNTLEWTFKVAGSYKLPADVTVSSTFESRSGDTWARQVAFTGGRTIPSIVLNVEPIGARRMETIHMWNLRAEKTFKIVAGQKLAARVNLYNVLNVNTITALNARSGPAFMRPTYSPNGGFGIVAPRVLEFSASYQF